ncbi:TPA: hypothetical protein N0F65_011369 [Lagenidium giganteum]|uniref:Uncharacterized protein n=1 Tax=Lagenidium giganteum TaxID=4803 RepID=A0AAV2Z3U7_9STRA|nr:TPA: hypothetical protein N0F65_011369 [Lagenidium giganteum]
MTEAVRTTIVSSEIYHCQRRGVACCSAHCASSPIRSEITSERGLRDCYAKTSQALPSRTCCEIQGDGVEDFTNKQPMRTTVLGLQERADGSPIVNASVSF